MSAVIDDVDVVYPECDGKPRADNTLQWDWMVRMVSELRELFAGQDVFVAGDDRTDRVRGMEAAIEHERQRAEAYRAKLRELGIDPDRLGI